MARDLDIIVYGASGFTGLEVCLHIAKLRATVWRQRKIKWAIAGRNADKLSEVVKRCKLEIELAGEDSVVANALPCDTIIADVGNTKALVACFSRATLCLNCTGPYRFYGQAVVGACIKAKTHYMDLCGEPEFYEHVMLLFDKAARDAGIFLVHAAAWDSVPADIGVLLAARRARELKLVAGAVQVFHKFSDCSAAHVTTFEAAVHGFGTRKNLSSLRKSVARMHGNSTLRENVHRLRLSRKHGVKGKEFYWEPLLGAYAVRFPGSDSSVVRMSQEWLSGEGKRPDLCPVPYVYFLVESSIWLVITLFLGAIFSFLANFAFGRRLLLAFPGVFSLGMFTKAGPSKEQLAAGSFTTVVSAFCRSPNSEGSYDKDAPVTQGAVVVTIRGPEPGYVATPQLYVAMARTLLEDILPSASRVPGSHSGKTAGCCMPACLVGAGQALDGLVSKIKESGISISIEAKPARMRLVKG